MIRPANQRLFSTGSGRGHDGCHVLASAVGSEQEVVPQRTAMDRRHLHCCLTHSRHARLVGSFAGDLRCLGPPGIVGCRRCATGLRVVRVNRRIQEERLEESPPRPGRLLSDWESVPTRQQCFSRHGGLLARPQIGQLGTPRSAGHARGRRGAAALAGLRGVAALCQVLQPGVEEVLDEGSGRGLDGMTHGSSVAATGNENAPSTSNPLPGPASQVAEYWCLEPETECDLAFADGTDCRLPMREHARETLT